MVVNQVSSSVGRSSQGSTGGPEDAGYRSVQPKSTEHFEMLRTRFFVPFLKYILNKDRRKPPDDSLNNSDQEESFLADLMFEMRWITLFHDLSYDIWQGVSIKWQKTIDDITHDYPEAQAVIAKGRLLQHFGAECFEGVDLGLPDMSENLEESPAYLFHASSLGAFLAEDILEILNEHGTNIFYDDRVQGKIISRFGAAGISRESVTQLSFDEVLSGRDNRGGRIRRRIAGDLPSELLTALRADAPLQPPKPDSVLSPTPSRESTAPMTQTPSAAAVKEQPVFKSIDVINHDHIQKVLKSPDFSKWLYEVLVDGGMEEEYYAVLSDVFSPKQRLEELAGVIEKTPVAARDFVIQIYTNPPFSIDSEVFSALRASEVMENEPIFDESARLYVEQALVVKFCEDLGIEIKKRAKVEAVTAKEPVLDEQEPAQDKVDIAALSDAEILASHAYLNWLNDVFDDKEIVFSVRAYVEDELPLSEIVEGFNAELGDGEEELTADQLNERIKNAFGQVLGNKNLSKIAAKERLLVLYRKQNGISSQPATDVPDAAVVSAANDDTPGGADAALDPNIDVIETFKSKGFETWLNEMIDPRAKEKSGRALREFLYTDDKLSTIRERLELSTNLAKGVNRVCAGPLGLKQEVIGKGPTSFNPPDRQKLRQLILAKYIAAGGEPVLHTAAVPTSEAADDREAMKQAGGAQVDMPNPPTDEAGVATAGGDFARAAHIEHQTEPEQPESAPAPVTGAQADNPGGSENNEGALSSDPGIHQEQAQMTAVSLSQLAQMLQGRGHNGDAIDPNTLQALFNARTAESMSKMADANLEMARMTAAMATAILGENARLRQRLEKPETTQGNGHHPAPNVR